MSKKRVVITGIGVVSPIGTGKETFWKSLKEGRSGAKPVTLFDTSTTRSKMACEISDFDASVILGPKGLRNMDRTTLLALSASKLALDDARITYPIPEDDTDMYGVSLGSTMGSVWSISEFDKTSLREGPRAVNPALFPNTVINSPASHISIKFNIQGFNSTISTGFCSSLDAIFYAMNMMQLYDYKVVLAGGVEELCEQTFKGFHKIGHLAGARPGKEEINCPFDKRRNGILVGEGACIFILEQIEHALGRQANIYAEVTGYGSAFDIESRNIYSPKAAGAAEAMEICLKDAGILSKDIGCICATANSTLDCDVMETRAIRKVFGECAMGIPVSGVKSMLGETFSAAGAMNICASLGMFAQSVIYPTVNYSSRDTRCDLDVVSGLARPSKSVNILVDSFSPTGCNSVLALKRYE